VRLYIDNLAIGDSAVAADNQWRVTLPDTVEPGLYTLRVDELDGEGTVTARVETPFKREDRQGLAAALGVAEPAETPETPAAPPDPGEEAVAVDAPEAPTPTPTPEAPTEAEPAPEPEAEPLIAAITVQPGSTLWAISRERYGDGNLYVQVFEANRDKILDPDLIYPGQVFDLPEGVAAQ